MIAIEEPWSLTLAWESLLRRILADGEESSPRGMKTRELMHVDVHFDQPREYVFYNPVRRVNPVMHIVELFYFLNSRSDDVLVTRWLRGMENYLNPETRLFDGGYGPSLGQYLPYVFAELRRDPDSRRAVIPILRPDHVATMSVTRDYPCNPLLGFNLRRGNLNMWVVTRSQDMMQGYIYDQLEWRLLQLMVAKALGRHVGSFDHHMVSCHLYERDFERATASLGKSVPTAEWPELPIDSVQNFWDFTRSMNVTVDFPMMRQEGFDVQEAPQRYWSRKENEAWVNAEPIGLFTNWVRDWARLNREAAHNSRS